MTAAALCRDAIAACFQCGRANPEHGFDGIVEGESRQFCCAGCRAIAQTIGAAGPNDEIVVLTRGDGGDFLGTLHEQRRGRSIITLEVGG